MDYQERFRLLLEMHRRRLKKRGVLNSRCLCGETDLACFEVEHPYRRAHDNYTYGICCNCHRKKSAWEQVAHPPANLFVGNGYARRAHRYLGMSSYLRSIADRLEEDGERMSKLAEKGLDCED